MPVNIVVRPFVFLLSFALSSGFLTQAASACECPPTPDVAAALRTANAVFEGTVIQLSPASKGSDLVEFAVTRTWKGIATESVAVVTPNNLAACGLEFVSGRSYLVYAESHPGGPASGLSIGACGRTKLSSVATVETQELGLGEVPVTPPENMRRRNVELGRKAGAAGCSMAHHSGGVPMSALIFVFGFGACLLRRRAA